MGGVKEQQSASADTYFVPAQLSLDLDTTCWATLSFGEQLLMPNFPIAYVWFRWSSTVSLGIFGATFFWYLCRFQRKFNDFGPGEWEHFLYVGKIGVLGWVFHYRKSCDCLKRDHY